ncbi:MAG TPA: ATP-binding protein [Acholeplasmataceae bacterium]|nr:ATP-binding protein [Acholeplasmataceae bacterium]
MGVNDKGEVIGLDNIDYGNLKLKIENRIKDVIIPRPDYEIKIVQNNKKNILEIIVYPGDNTPYLYKGVAYQRKDTSTLPVDQS